MEEYGNVIYERSFVNTIRNVYVIVQMAKPSKRKIDMFVVQLDRLLESIFDTNGNDNYVPKEDFIGEQTTLLERIEDGLSRGSLLEFRNHIR